MRFQATHPFIIGAEGFNASKEDGITQSGPEIWEDMRTLVSYAHP
jgi:hypothetical protein